MNQARILLSPRVLSIKNRGAKHAEGRTARILLFGGLGAAFWLGILLLFLRVLFYFKSVQGFGDVLAEKLLSMVFTTFFALLLFSSVLTALSKLYLSRDLALVHSYPVRHDTIFFARWVESLADAAWMVLVYALPVFLAYGMVYGKGIFFYADIVMALVPFCVSASILSTLAVMLIVLVLPAHRFRALLIFLGLTLFVLLYVALRLARPERLVDPDTSASVVAYLATLRTPASPWLPSTWAFDSLREALHGNNKTAMFHNGLAATAACSLVFITTWIARFAYFKGASKAQSGRVAHSGLIKEKHWASRPLPWFTGPKRAFLVKEARTFFRDQTQWPQVFLMAALIGIYLYNFKVLPIEKAPIKAVYLQNVLAFLNMGLASFVMTALAARFVFPAVSMEKEAFWIVKSSPVSLRTALWIKFFIYLVPLLLLSEVLVVSTNVLLSVTPFMMGLSMATVFCMVPGIIALGIGLGAAYPDFQAEDIAQTVTGFGGVLFMILSALFIGAVIVLEAGPVYAVVSAGFRGKALGTWTMAWLLASFAIVAVLCVLAVVLPMRFGCRRLETSRP